MTPTWTDDDDLPEASEVSAHEGALGAAVARLQSTKNVTFATRHLGGGYDRAEVDAFREEISKAVEDVRAALESERHELATLRAENAKLRTPANADLDQEIALGAVGLLSQAQLIADKAIADAELYARDLVITARTQYREVLERAESSTDHASPTQAAPPGPAMPEIEYVRTYAQVAKIQLRSVLDALTEQVDRLGTLPDPAAEPPEPSPSPSAAWTPSASDDVPEEEPDWTPAPQPTMQRQTFISP